jgi:hypothetical protein
MDINDNDQVAARLQEIYLLMDEFEHYGGRLKDLMALIEEEKMLYEVMENNYTDYCIAEFEKQWN